MIAKLTKVAAKQLCDDVLVNAVLDNINNKSDTMYPSEEELLDLLAIAEYLYIKSMKPIEKQWAPCTNWINGVRFALRRAGKELLEEEKHEEKKTTTGTENAVTGKNSSLVLVD